jgi:hypothetical protein
VRLRFLDELLRITHNSNYSILSNFRSSMALGGALGSL